ncbi:polysaccharide lyase family 7 protein [Microvirga terrestris]|uniref:Polysaccharide lyase family 7 protein n=1 Tax=Microvirga terrestris TaxID=2791024 RepID=A0ABS0HUL1_9HYPH|nr:polysaccharide lyase family 7 protein [Microvirga terrestris]MBF9197168.1 polysaccharide lyase family 7 protein [Microvirga terrestris]
MALSSSLTPSRNFDLKHWKITLPADRYGTFSGTAYEVKNLNAYVSPKYFYTGSDGAMVFKAPVGGATTSGSRYARSELREMNGSERAAWTIAEGGVMRATLEIDQAPVLFNGAKGRIVVGQVHGQEDELVRLYWERNTLYFVNDIAGATGQETKFVLTNKVGLRPNVGLNERFSYSIDVTTDRVKVTVSADGQTYAATDYINQAWRSDALYFKAGTYLGVNETQGTGYGQTSFYDLKFSHSIKAPQVAFKVNQLPSTSKTYSGTSIGDKLTGSSGNDRIEGKGGNDMIWGKSGNDILVGSSGNDSFTFDTKLSAGNIDVILNFNVKDDTIRLNDSVFTKLSSGRLAPDNFVVGPKASDAREQIIYNNKTGGLFYDPDGSGQTRAIQFAKIDSGLKLTAADFLVM